MKNSIKVLGLLIMFLTACTDKKSQTSNVSETSKVEPDQLQEMETLTNEMEETTLKIEEKADELDALLEELDN